MKRILSLVIATLWLAAPGAQAKDSIDVMTQNQYLGADLNPIINAEGPAEFNAAVIKALEDVAANDFPARAEKLAELIGDRLPELVGLQEVFIFQCTDLGPSVTDEGCDNPRISNAFNDHLSLTLANLTALGEDYSAVATVVNFNTGSVIVPPLLFPGIPFNIEGYNALVNIYDRDVILARSDIAGSATPVDFTVFQPFGICLKPSADGCNYQLVATATLPGGVTISQERGYVGVDVTVGEKDYRFINTHLEVQRPDGTDLSSIVQAAQAQELITTLANVPHGNRSLIVVGDINSSPDDPLIFVPAPIPPGFPPVIVPPYTQFVGSGYTDAWDLRPGSAPGFTCCQDDDLLNHQSQHDERIDVIFSVDVPNKVKKARVLGSRVSDKTSPPGHGLWPADHGSVAATLEFP
ncbi:MAG: hypothetical protein JRG90_04330 [Deltaproteobacteria bacterium]|nr:hypothetical protein [Deltaproteobacteria bacterium]